MRSPFALLLAGSVFLFGQAPAPDAVPVAPRARVGQADTPFAAARDAELLSSPVSLDELTEERATQLEQAARRQLDRTKSHLEQARTLVDAGLAPAKSLEAPTEELAWAESTYDITLSRKKLVDKVAEMALAEQQVFEPLPAPVANAAPPVMERFDGDGKFTTADYLRVQSAFEQQFHEPLPVSAEGETAVHRAMHFDHRNRVDVALYPDTTEGKWLRHFLEARHIPYYVFRSMVPGKATAAHIHIGPPSTRLI